MKKIIISFLIFLTVLPACEIIILENIDEIEVGKIENYDFENNIKISSIEEASNYVFWNMEYTPDENEYWQTPEETYNRRNDKNKMLGDCEDYAIFLSFLLKNKLGVDCYIIHAYAFQQKGYHAFIFLPEQDKYIEPIWGDYCVKEYIQDSYNIIYLIPYEEALWMAYYYHRKVGKYK